MSFSSEEDILRELKWEKMKYDLVKNYLKNKEIGNVNRNNYLLNNFPKKIKLIYKEKLYENAIEMIESFLKKLIITYKCSTIHVPNNNNSIIYCEGCRKSLYLNLNNFDINELYKKSNNVCDFFLKFIKIFITPSENIEL